MSILFEGIFDSELVSVISLWQFLLCILIGLLVGFVLAWAYTYRSVYTKSFVITLATLPAVVCVVILMVNGNVGTGVAVAGTFSLVRFRSIPGTAKEIGAIFIAMGSGLMIGMGYLGFSVVFTIVLSMVTILYIQSDFGENKESLDRTITITIPEDLNYTNVFDEIFVKYTSNHKITFVKTTNMGSLFKITYNIRLIDLEIEKVFIDELRCRNGNLEIAISPLQMSSNEL